MGCHNRHDDFFLIYPCIASSPHHIHDQTESFSLNQDTPQIDADMLYQ